MTYATPGDTADSPADTVTLSLSKEQRPALGH
jgi:hypothetical protein